MLMEFSMKFTTTIPVYLGGVVFRAGEHDAKVEKDWFFDALVSDGALIIIEDDEVIEDAPVNVVGTEKKKKSE